MQLTTISLAAGLLAVTAAVPTRITPLKPASAAGVNVWHKRTIDSMHSNIFRRDPGSSSSSGGGSGSSLENGSSSTGGGSGSATNNGGPSSSGGGSGSSLENGSSSTGGGSGSATNNGAPSSSGGGSGSSLENGSSSTGGGSSSAGKNDGSSPPGGGSGSSLENGSSSTGGGSGSSLENGSSSTGGGSSSAGKNDGPSPPGGGSGDTSDNGGTSGGGSSTNNGSGNNNGGGVGAGSPNYTPYSGDGSAGAGWPTTSQWVSFDDMFNNNKPHMFISCAQFNVPDDSDSEVTAIYNGIQAVAQQSSVDSRFILAVIMQESGGCVRAPTTNNGFANPGLMQDFQGTNSCNSNGVVSTPCPDNVIQGMIQDGAQGTGSGVGLASNIQSAEAAGTTDGQTIYWAARLYNSGSVCNDDLSNACGATASYSSDIANRLTGWIG